MEQLPVSPFKTLRATRTIDTTNNLATTILPNTEGVAIRNQPAPGIRKTAFSDCFVN